MLLCIMSDHCEILRVIRHNRYLDLGNGSKKLGNHWSKLKIRSISLEASSVICSFSEFDPLLQKWFNFVLYVIYIAGRSLPGLQSELKIWGIRFFSRTELFIGIEFQTLKKILSLANVFYSEAKTISCFLCCVTSI